MPKFKKLEPGVLGVQAFFGYVNLSLRSVPGQRRIPGIHPVGFRPRKYIRKVSKAIFS